MHLNWHRGLFRALIVFVVAGAAYAGWQSGNESNEGNCWSRIAKWPDGQSFSVFDLFEEANTRGNVELNKIKGAWSAESIANRNQWVVSTRARLFACEIGGRAVPPVIKKPIDVWANLRNSLLGVFLPPLAILMAGWIATGFRASKA